MSMGIASRFATCVGTPRDDVVPADLVRQRFAAESRRGGFVSIRRRRRDRRDIENAHVLRQAGDHEIDVEFRDLLCGGIRARVDKHLEPDAKTVRVESFVPTRPVGPPQIAIEDAAQLVGRGQRDEIAAVLEAACLDHAMEQFRREARHHLGEPRRVENPIEQRTLAGGAKRDGWGTAARAAACSGHGPAMIAGAV